MTAKQTSEPTSKPNFRPTSIVQLVHLDQTGDTLYRMKWPAEALSEISPESTIINLSATDERRFDWGLKADLLIIFQSQDLDLLPLIEERRKKNLRTLVEYNDNFYDPPVASPIYEAWTSLKVWRDYEIIMRAADGVIVTCNSLKNLFSSKTKAPITVLKNHLPDKELPAFETKIERWNQPELRLGWGGSMGHFTDLLASYPFVRELMGEIPSLHLSLMGNDMIPDHIDLSRERFHFTNWGSMSDYYEFLDTQHIGFIPLLNNPYNKCRSDIKAVEMISRGVLPVIPAAPPYDDLVKETGLPTYKNFFEMKEIIRFFVSDREKSKEFLRKAYEYISKKRLRRAVQERKDFYHSFIDQTNEFPIPAGYYEYRSETQFSPSQDIFEKVQRLGKLGYHRKALDLLDEGMKSNSKIIDFKVQYLQILKQTDNKKWIEEVGMLSSEQLEDYRLKAMKMETIQDRELVLYLDKLFSDILKIPENSRKHLSPSVGVSLIRLLKKDIQLLPQIEKFMPLFPRFALLRLEIAKAFQATNRREEALAEYEKILEVVETIESSKDALLSLSPAYFRTLVESARADPKRVWE